MIVTYFLSGLFFSLRASIVFHTGKSSAFKLTDTLWLIAAFGVIYDGTEVC